MKSSLDKIFCKVVYHHIIYTCDFLVNLDDVFVVICTSFYESCGFHQICFNALVGQAKIWHTTENLAVFGFVPRFGQLVKIWQVPATGNCQRAASPGEQNGRPNLAWQHN